MIGYPPYIFLVKCFDECPAAIFTYIFLWKDSIRNKVSLDKKHIEDKYLTPLQDFRQYLFLLREAHLINYKEGWINFSIEIQTENSADKGVKAC